MRKITLTDEQKKEKRAQQLGDYIKRQMRKSQPKITQAQLATRIGKSQSSVSKMLDTGNIDFMDLVLILSIVGASDEDRARLTAL